MALHTAPAARVRFGRPRAIFFSLAALLAPLAATITATAADGQTIVRVEEDWELVVGEPDTDTQSPQVTTVISPVPSVDSIYAAFNLNHKTVPEYERGGMQLQLWNADAAVESAQLGGDTLLNAPAEVVRWTQQMHLDQGQLEFEVVNGTSTTWGSFGDNHKLRGTITTSLTDLNGYNPATSVENSGVGYAGNRVTSLVLKRVRTYSAQGLIAEDDSPKVVYPHD